MRIYDSYSYRKLPDSKRIVNKSPFYELKFMESEESHSKITIEDRELKTESLCSVHLRIQCMKHLNDKVSSCIFLLLEC